MVMVSLHLFLLLLVAGFCATQQPIRTDPEQVHLAYTNEPSEMVVTWITMNYTDESVVEYGVSGLDQTTYGAPPTKFTDGGSEQRSMYVHSVTLTALSPGTRYTYHVGGHQSGWSDLFRFRTMPSRGSAWSPSFAVYGDLGNINAVALPALQEEAQRGTIDAVLHVGDFAYDMNDDNARFGDVFMRQIQPIAAYVPYMVCPGNHEDAYNFSNYKARFSMPSGGDENRMFWSWNVGPAHIISFNTEVFYQEEFGSNEQIVTQYKWLEQDLQVANARRSQQPWVIVMGHRPMYCSTNDGYGQHCNNVDHNPIRVSQAGLPGLEDLFYKHGVDLHFYAHEHSYERLWPVYNKQVCNGTQGAYTNPSGPVHIVTGSAGNQEGQTKFDPVPWPWSAFRSDDFGYTKMQVINATHLSLDQISIDQGGKVIDSMMLIKNKHGLGSFTCHMENTLKWKKAKSFGYSKNSFKNDIL